MHVFMSFPLGKGELWAPVINMWLFRGYLWNFIPEILFNHKLSRILWQDPAFWFSSAVSYRIWLKGTNLGELVYATIKTGMCVCENWGVLKREIIAVFKIVINFRFTRTVDFHIHLLLLANIFHVLFFPSALLADLWVLDLMASGIPWFLFT